jgi:hypothetical protein
MRVVPNVRRASSSPEEDPRVIKLLRAMKGDTKLASIVQEFEERAQKADGGRTFGSNGLKVNSKLFALFTQRTLVVKLPKNRVADSTSKRGVVPESVPRRPPGCLTFPCRPCDGQTSPCASKFLLT